MPRKTSTVIPSEAIGASIVLVRGQKVILDSTLASLYQVEVKDLNRAVKRNLDRFPDDFMIQLCEEEVASLRCQIGTLKSGRGQHRKYLPHAFTEQGIAIPSSVLRSPRAIQVNIEIMRAFVRLRPLLASNAQLARKLDALERKYDALFRTVFDAIRALMTPPPSSRKRPIGFGPWEK